MSFGLKPNTPHIANYAAALAVYEKIKPWRGDAEDAARPLDKNRAKKHMTIRKLVNGDIACRLFSTDVVTYCSDGSIEINGYNSRSTTVFANALLDGIVCDFTGVGGVILGRSMIYWRTTEPQRIYRMPERGPVKLLPQPDGSVPWAVSPETPAPAFVALRLDRVKARAACKKHNVDDFLMWMRAALAMGGVECGDPRYLRSSDVCAMLRDQQQWQELLEGANVRYAVRAEALRRVNDMVRRAVYDAEGCVVTEDVPYFTSWSDAQKWRASRRRLSWAL